MQLSINKNKKELKMHGSEDFPILISREEIFDYEGCAFSWHWHPEIEITYIMEGNLNYQINNQRFRLQSGDVLFGNINTLHRGFHENGENCKYISITFLPTLLFGNAQNRLYENYIKPIIFNLQLPAIYFPVADKQNTLTSDIIMQIIRLHDAPTPFTDYDILIHLQQLWRFIAENYRIYECLTKSPLDYEKIRIILNYIEDSYSMPITLSDISRQVHLCESECCRMFKRYMNTTIFSFLQNYRIERSLEFLSDNACSIDTVAGLVGFQDSNYYSKTFKKLKGKSPREFRKATVLK